MYKRVRGDPALSHFVHFRGSDLQFHPFMVRTDNGGVDRAIVILFRSRDVILETAGYDAPVLMHQAEGTVAIIDRGHDHPKAVDIGKLPE